MKILIIEDDLRLCGAIEKMLANAGYSTISSHDGEDGLYHLVENTCDAAILDRMLPKLDGLSLLKEARQKGVQTPVLMLTALDAIGHRVDGLDAGADDYLAKPFDMRELLARVHALARRPAQIENTSLIAFGNISLMPATMLLKGPGDEIYLTRKQADLMELLIRSNAPAVTREIIFNRVWGPNADVDGNVIDTYIAFLRRKLRAVDANVEIKTNRGVGYRLMLKA